MNDAPPEPHVLHIAIDLTAGGSWRIAVVRPHGETLDHRARLDPRRVRRLRAELAAAAAGDGDAAARARVLVFESSAALAGAVGEARGHARARQIPLCLVIEAADPGIAELAFEALEAPAPATLAAEATRGPGARPPESPSDAPAAAGSLGDPARAPHDARPEVSLDPDDISAVRPPLDDDPTALEAHDLIVVRLVGAGAAPPPGGPRRGPATRAWAPADAPADDRAALDALCAELELPLPVELDVPPPLGHAAILYVADGPAALGTLRPAAPTGPPAGPMVTLSLDPTPRERRQPSRALADHPAALRAALAAADLVVLVAPDRTRALDHAALAADARAVFVVPAAPRDARFAALTALYRALASGQGLAAAAATARRAFALRADVAGPTLTVTHPSLAGRRLVGPERRPVGWPMPDADAARLIEAAWQIAEITEGGYLGVEHLALALADAEPRRRLRRLRYQLKNRRRHIESRLAAYTPRRAHSTPRPTPRLAALGAHLADGFDLEALWQVIVDRAGDALRVLLGDHDSPVDPHVDAGAAYDRDAVTAPQSAHDAGPAAAIEIVTGPEDGRRITLAPGEALGRASGSHKADHRLYDDTDLTDPALSRRHLIWRGPGHLEICTATRHPRGGAGPRDLARGALIGLTHCTWIRGVG